MFSRTRPWPMKRPWWGATRYLVVRSLAHPGACVRTQVCAGFAYFIAIAFARSQTTVPALGDRQFGLLDVTKARREDRETRMGLRGRTLRGASSKRTAEPPPQRDADCRLRIRFCQDMFGYYPLTYCWYIALVSSRRDAHLSILNFASGNLNLQPWNV